MNLLKIVFIMTLACGSCCGGIPSNIQEIYSYIQQLPEAVNPVGKENWLDPNFDTFYQKLFLPPVWRRLLLDFGIDASPLKEGDLRLILNGYLQRDYKDILKQEDSNFVLLDTQAGDEFFIVGDLHGAIHSLERLFIQWYQAGKLSQDLQILDPNLRVIFLGDYVNRSPYGFFLLPILISFANKNPEQVFLLRGRQESDRYWEQFLASRHFLTQLIGQYNAIDAFGVLPLSVEINNFFDQLPDGIIYTHRNTGEQILIAHNKMPHGLTPSPNTVALIRGENRTQRMISDRGLFFDQFYQGTATWDLFSAPVVVYSRIGLLSDDSYSIIPVGDSFAVSSIIGVESTPFDLVACKDCVHYPIEQRQRRFSLAYGHQLQTLESLRALASGKPRFVCSSVDLTGGLQGMGMGLKEGMEAAFLWANYTQKVPEVYFRPVVLDDGYDPETMNNNLDLFIQRFSADSMLLAMGSPTVASILPRMQKDDMVLFFPATGSPEFRERSLKNIIHLRRSYAEEVYPLIDRTRMFYGARKYAFVYQNDAFGRPLTQAAQKYLAQRYPECQALAIPILRAHKPSQENIEKLRRFNPDAIGFFVSSQVQLSGFADQLGSNFLLNKELFAIDFSSDIFYEFAARWGLPVLHMSSFQRPNGTTGSLMETYRNVMRMYRYALSRSSVEAFAATTFYLEAMKRSAPDFSARAILQELTAIDPQKVCGCQMNFDALTHSFTGPLWMDAAGTIYRVEKLANGDYAFDSIVL